MFEPVGITNCPACHQLAGKMFDFLIQWYTALERSAGADPITLTSPGICPFHLRRMLKLSSPAGFDEAFAGTIKGVAAYLEEIAALSLNQVEILQQGMWTDVRCCACEFHRSEEQQILMEIVRHLQTPDGRSRYVQSGGVCLQHLPLLWRNLTEDASKHFVLFTAIRSLRETAEDMEEFVRKNKGRLRDLLEGPERVAHLRSANLLAGSEAIRDSLVVPLVLT